MRARHVQHLLMGGQACVLYGAAEFSRDADLAIVADSANLTRLVAAVQDLQAVVTAVPPFEATYLERGHAVHFRAERSDVRGLRIDVMSLPDLVTAKKTQRDKDWPMIRRLVEANYFQFREDATEVRVEFWLRQLRTPELLAECVRAFPDTAHRIATERTVVARQLGADIAGVESELAAEEARERALDRAYWAPLRVED